jgi:hypothetical protein
MKRLRWRRIAIGGVLGGLLLGTVLAFAIALIWPPPPIPANVAFLGDRSLLDPAQTNTFTGTHITLTDNLRAYDHTVRLEPTDLGRLVDPMSFECHGGIATVVWHVGNLEPTYPNTGIHLTALLDDEPIASIIVGSTSGVYEDSPAELQTIVDCPAGVHALALEVTDIHGVWGFPYVVSELDSPSLDLRVNRGFRVSEIW